MATGLDTSAILKRLTKADKQTKTSQDQQYKELLASISGLGKQTGGTFDAAEQALANVGLASRERVTRNYANLLGQADQDLTSRGLGNTTIRSAVQRGIASDRELAYNQISESEAGQRSSLLQNRAGMEFNVGNRMANAIEGRTFLGPDVSLYASLLSQAGAGGSPQPLQATVGPMSSGIPFSQGLRSWANQGSGGGGTVSSGGGGGGSSGGGGFSSGSGSSGGGSSGSGGNKAYVHYGGGNVTQPTLQPLSGTLTGWGYGGQAGSTVAPPTSSPSATSPTQGTRTWSFVKNKGSNQGLIIVSAPTLAEAIKKAGPDAQFMGAR